MGNIDGLTRKEKRAIRRMRKIQAGIPEGTKQYFDPESLLTMGGVDSNNIGGVENNYKTYASQVAESYRKYNSMSDWGCQQFRALADIRTSFIAGEGMSITGEETTTAWIEKFLNDNKMFGSRFFDLGIGLELTGKALLVLRPKGPGEIPRIIRVPYSTDAPYQIKLIDVWDPDTIEGVYISKKNGTKKERLNLGAFVYVRTGGDDREVNETTTKVGAILNDVENYDRAQKDMRLLNHDTARITPTFETETQEEADSLKKQLNGTRWKIGQAFIGKPKFTYEVPSTGAHDNLKSEMSSSLKTASAVTGVPVHWVGWTDLLSNRSTADSLMDTITNATVRERTILAEGMHSLIVKAQEMYIIGGGTDITEVDETFEVRIPVVDYTQFLDRVRALSIAFGDEVISRSDYQSGIPGINPIKTDRALEQEKAAEDERMLGIVGSTVVPEEPEGDIDERREDDGEG